LTTDRDTISQNGTISFTDFLQVTTSAAWKKFQTEWLQYWTAEQAIFKFYKDKTEDEKEVDVLKMSLVHRYES